MLVDVAGAGVNPIDWKILSGAMKAFIPLPLPFTPGVEVAGTVVAVGSGLTQNRSFAVLKKHGVLVSPVSLPNMSLANDYGVTPANFATRSDGRQLSLIAELFDKGHLTVDVEAPCARHR